MFLRRSRPPRGLTLVELATSMAVVGLIMIALATLSSAVQIASEYTLGHETAVQHARVIAQRIDRAMQSAYGSDTYPGTSVLATTVAGYSFPNTLVIWKPSGTPANAAGPPLVSEIVIYTPNPTAPNELLEVTNTADNSSLTVSPVSSLQSQIDGIVRSSSSKKTVLTNLMRTANVTSNSGGSSANNQQAGVRFVLTVTPSTAEYANYKAGTLSWDSLSWPLYLYGAQTGTRQVWVRWELQLYSGYVGGVSTAGLDVVPYPGSTTRTYPIHP